MGKLENGKYEAQLERNSIVKRKIDSVIESNTQDQSKIQEAGEMLNRLSRWQSLMACKNMCRLGLFGKVEEVLPLMGFHGIEPTSKNINDFIEIELEILNAALDKDASA